MANPIHEGLMSRVKDPAIKHFLHDSLKLAKDSNASSSLVQSLETGVEMCYQRLRFEEDHTSDESATCQRIKAETFKNDWTKVHQEGKTKWDISSSQMSNKTESQFLKSFVSAIGAKNILEIGMYTGYTGLSMAEALPEGGKITCLDQDEYLREYHQALSKDSPHRHKMDIVIGPAINSMKEMAKQGRQFDLIFFDSDDNEFAEYAKICLEQNLLAPRGTILADNAFMYGESYADTNSAMARWSRDLLTNPGLHVVLLPIKDGIYMIRRRSEVDGGVC